MKEKYKTVSVSQSGLVCDNKSCNYEMGESLDFKDLEVYINEPCPLCEENLLTREDYYFWKRVRSLMNFINILLFPIMWIRGGRKDDDEIESIEVHHHDGKTIIGEKDSSESLVNSESEENEKRMRVVGQNGNTGEHYD